MKYCANCGSELNQGGRCPNCETSPKNSVLTSVIGTQGEWVTVMMRFFLLATALSTFMYLLRWPQALVTNPRSISADDNFYFLLLTIALFGTVALAVSVRNNVALVSGFLLAGVAVWVLPEFILSFFAQNPFGRGDYTPGALDNLISLLLTPSNLAGPLPETLISIGFYLLSFAHLPVAFLGFFSIAQESISSNLRSRDEQEVEVRKESNLAIGAFIAAFLVPIAGIVLSLIGILKWPEHDSRSRGLLVSALGISLLNFLISGLLFAMFLLGIFGKLLEGNLF
jgi:hypothetical protein